MGTSTSTVPVTMQGYTPMLVEMEEYTCAFEDERTRRVSKQR